MDSLVLKKYYYEVVHWQIQLYINYVRNDLYPKKYWLKQLKKLLKSRNKYILKIKNNVECKNGIQLKLF